MTPGFNQIDPFRVGQNRVNTLLFEGIEPFRKLTNVFDNAFLTQSGTVKPLISSTIPLVGA